MGTLISSKINIIMLRYFTVFSDIVYLLFNVQASKSKMPTKHVRKTNRSIRSPDVLEIAAKQVLEGLSYRKAVENFGVDKLTLMRFIKKADPTCVVGTQSTILSNQILTPAMEKDLASHIVLFAYMYFGLSIKRCKELAFRFATEDKMPVQNHGKKIEKQESSGGKASRIGIILFVVALLDALAEQPGLDGPGWIYLWNFWGTHISELTGCTPERKILVIMENHESNISFVASDATLDVITSNLMFSTHHLMFLLMNVMLSSLPASYKLQ